MSDPNTSYYPQVLGEWETLAQLLLGKSIARFGDGEFKLIDGAEQCREPKNPTLASELRHVLLKHDKRCLVGVPTMDPRGPKHRSWMRHYRRFGLLMRRGPRVYHSAFISRPDSAPWIRTREYALLIQKLWLGKRVALVCEQDGAMRRAVAFGAREIEHIVCPSHKAYAALSWIEPAVLAAKADIAILSCGPAASCLAHRLAKQDLQAIDLGSGGAFIAKLLSE
jgi:hypothetical protein